MSKMREQINNAQADCNKTSKELQNLGTQEEDSGKKATDASKNFENLKKVLADMGKVVAGAVTAIGAGAVMAGKEIVSLSKDVAEAGDTIDKESQKLSISAESYQKLSYAMQRNGTDIGAVSKGIKAITTAIADTANGVDGASEKFDKLGVSLLNANGTMRSQEEVLMDSIDALAKMGEGAERDALAQDIFGKSASELKPLLNAGADSLNALMKEAEDYGMVMSDDAVKASVNFKDSLTKLKGTITGAKNSLMGDFLPSLTQITNGFSDLINGNEKAGDSIKEGIKNAVLTLNEMLPKLNEFITFVAQAVLDL